MLKISWNADEIAIRLRGLRLTLADREGAHRIMGEVLLRNTWARFRREVSPDGRKWPPLSPVTLAARRNKRGILRDTGELFTSIQMQADARRAEVGTPLDHPKVFTHQFGATIKPRRAKALRIPGAGSVVPGRNHPDLFARKVKVPPRPYIGISADDAADVLEALAGWLEARQRRLPGPKR